MTLPSHDRAALLTFVRGALGEEWAVQADDGAAERAASIVVAHPLAGSAYHVLRESDGDYVAQMESRLQAPEYRVVADRPLSMPHMELVGHLRSFAAAHELSDRSLEALGALLNEDGALTFEEAAWLAWAGRAWSQEEPPTPTFAEFLRDIEQE